jgi:muramoyltetrapeptide carboxypeptidase
MKKRVFPKKLQKGDLVRVIAPASSFAIISQENREIARKRFEEMGLRLSFGKHIEEIDENNSSNITSRISDLHDAFSDEEVSAVMAVIGGFNSNQLLSFIDWEIIEKNPKIFCGYSDITVLGNAFFSKTGLVTYSGPGYASFGEKYGFEYTHSFFKKCLFSEESFLVEPSKQWSDDPWYRDQESRKWIPNDGYLAVQEGEAEGVILGANLCTFNLLQGTEYMPDLDKTILFLEDDHESKLVNFDRDLQSLIHQPGFEKVRGIVLGRFQQSSVVTNDAIVRMVRTKKELKNIPVIANVDFGHTQPMITFPLGGRVRIQSLRHLKCELEIIEH